MVRRMKDLHSKVIPFYGGEKPRLFEIERRFMDRDGVVLRFLDHILPSGWVLDIGAGNGFVADSLTGRNRTVVAMEPEPKMIDKRASLLWSRGVAQGIPFHDDVFAAAYATWAFFLPGVGHKLEGLAEVRRVVIPNGVIVIIDNAGDDEFCSLSKTTISNDGKWYASHGFERRVLETSFRFDSLDEARELLGFYFGEDIRDAIKKPEIEYKIAAYVGRSPTGR